MEFHKFLPLAAAAMAVAPSAASAGTRAGDSVATSGKSGVDSTPPASVGPPGHDPEHHNDQGKGNHFGWFKEHDDNGKHKGWFKSRGAG
jgi:hypothetical protein